jgi:CheY-like chemotaxis protein
MGYKILIIDDTRVIRDFLTEVLTDYGYEVENARDGREGLEKVVSGRFDLVFCDVHMPNLNGLQTIKAILKEFPEMPIVMTDSFPGRLAEEARAAGALTCLSKPFSLDDLKATVNRILNKEKIPLR